MRILCIAQDAMVPCTMSIFFESRTNLYSLCKRKRTNLGWNQPYHEEFGNGHHGQIQGLAHLSPHGRRTMLAFQPRTRRSRHQSHRYPVHRASRPLNRTRAGISARKGNSIPSWLSSSQPGRLGDRPSLLPWSVSQIRRPPLPEWWAFWFQALSLVGRLRRTYCSRDGKALCAVP